MQVPQAVVALARVRGGARQAAHLRNVGPSTSAEWHPNGAGARPIDTAAGFNYGGGACGVGCRMELLRKTVIGTMSAGIASSFVITAAAGPWSSEMSGGSQHPAPRASSPRHPPSDREISAPHLQPAYRNVGFYDGPLYNVMGQVTGTYRGPVLGYSSSCNIFTPIGYLYICQNFTW
jgi:hypothetical protein